MSDPTIEKQARDLESEFFRKRDEELIARLRASKEREANLEELGACSGISDSDVLARLVDSGVRAETLPALSLVPLAAVAWADGRLDSSERHAIERAAKDAGVDEASPAFGLLQGLLEEAPKKPLIDAWMAFARSLASSAEPEALAEIRSFVVGRSKQVAEAAGGILGIASISVEERKLLEQIEEALGVS